MKTAIIVTTHCAGAGEDMKRKMTKTICKYLNQTPYFLCLASHTPIDEETQSYCDGFIYDKDNSFQIDGLPAQNLTHGMAELKSIHNAVNFLQRFGYTHFLKIAYDNNPDADYIDIIQKAEQICSSGFKMITAKWGNDISLGTHVFYSSIDFFKKNLSLEKPNVYQEQLEQSIFQEFMTTGVLGSVFLIENYNNFLGHSFIQYSHAGGTRVDHYPYDY
jgi:hypothetical protein